MYCPFRNKYFSCNEVATYVFVSEYSKISNNMLRVFFNEPKFSKKLGQVR
jgi:hypothetical protein